jgi:dihydroxy-acid dehydratase
LRSDEIKKGMTKAPHRALLKALGVTDKDVKKPFVAVVNSFTSVVPGHIRLNEIAVKPFHRGCFPLADLSI